jgi:V8-like Glu-specific endopeptidase
MNATKLIARFLKDVPNLSIRAEPSQFEAMRKDDESDVLEEFGVPGSLADIHEEVRKAANRAIIKVQKDGTKARLDPEEEFGLEAIILLRGRPAILIQDGKFQKPPSDWAILETHRARIQETIRSVGRIEVTNHPMGLDWVGTGFLVGEDVIMTNRHVAAEFCLLKPGTKKWVFEPGMTARIDFNESYKAKKPEEFPIKEIIGVHEKLDLALFRVGTKGAGGRTLPEPLRINTDKTRGKKGRQIYTVGYPAADSRRNDETEMRRIFNNIFNVKRLQPGEIAAAVAPTDSSFKHDCSTLGGNSGSCVVDLQTHQVLGLHYAGRYLESNSAVALWQLTKDPLLKKAEVNFADGEKKPASYTKRASSKKRTSSKKPKAR